MEKVAGKGQKAKDKRRITKTFLVPAFMLGLALAPSPFAFCQNPWPGVDESVVEKIAGEHGRHAREPLIDTDRGDLLLFVFLLAGALGGFAAGYYWRVLTEEKEKKG